LLPLFLLERGKEDIVRRIGGRKKRNGKALWASSILQLAIRGITEKATKGGKEGRRQSPSFYLPSSNLKEKREAIDIREKKGKRGEKKRGKLEDVLPFFPFSRLREKGEEKSVGGGRRGRKKRKERESPD